MRTVLLRFAAIAVLPIAGFAVSTRTWLSSSYADFAKGELRGVSLRSDGRLTLAPEAFEVFDSSLAYLWTLARDSKGVIYAGGGPGAKVYRFANLKSEKIAEFDAVEVHALAIDRQDRVYAATFPDGKIYRLNPAGKPELFYDPKQKYIWSMLFDPQGNLFVATGENGEIHRVTPDGKGSVFFNSNDTHVRSLAMTGSDLIAGTDPTGLVIRINPKGEGFVLYQLPKREITAVAIAPDGSVYAAGAGTQQVPGGASALLTAINTPAPPAPGPPAPPVPSPPPSRAIALTGGSEVYRIDPSGLPEKVWSHPQDVAYAIAFDRDGKALVGTGNKGVVYRIETPALYTALETVNVNQITALIPVADGSFLAASANLGNVYQFGPGLEPEGTVTSDVYDSGSFSQWGRLVPYGDSPNGTITLESHSGNLDRPRYYWSQWSATAPPAARFIQWRAKLKATGGGSPVLDSVEQSYLPRNVAPEVEEIESTPQNYKYPAPILPVLLQRAPSTIILPAIGRRTPSPGSTNSDPDASAMTYAKGWVGVRWNASDANGDALTYTLQIRGVRETTWKPLKDNLVERHYSWDSTAFPDGEYRVRVIASDQPGNPGGEALTGLLDSSPLLIDNTPPVVTGVSAIRETGGVHLTWRASDALSVIRRADYAIDGEDWVMADPVSRLSDAQTLAYSLTVRAVPSGEHTIAVRVTDDYDNTCVENTVINR